MAERLCNLVKAQNGGGTIEDVSNLFTGNVTAYKCGNVVTFTAYGDITRYGYIATMNSDAVKPIFAQDASAHYVSSGYPIPASGSVSAQGIYGAVNNSFAGTVYVSGTYLVS